MKTILALAIAITSLAAFGAPAANAETIVVKRSSHRSHRHYHHRPYHRHHDHHVTVIRER